MNFADRIGSSLETSAPSCRDRGWMTWRGGGLVPVLRGNTIRLGCLDINESPRTRTGTRPPHPLFPSPCPYRKAERSLLILIGKNHQALSKLENLIVPRCQQQREYGRASQQSQARQQAEAPRHEADNSG